MSNPRQTQHTPSPPSAEPHQTRIPFEFHCLHGLPAAERMKVVMDLACLLMRAAGVAGQEGDDEC